MRDLCLNPATGDLLIESRALRLTVDGAEAVAQKLRVRLRLFQGEYPLDTRVGVPWYTDILGRHPRATVEAILRRVIATCPGVDALESFTLSISAQRVASITFKVRAKGEPIIVENFILDVPSTGASASGAAAGVT